MPRSVRLQPYTLMLKIDPANLAHSGSETSTTAGSGASRTSGGRLARRMAMGATCSGTTNGGAASQNLAVAAAANGHADADEYMFTPDHEVSMASMTDGGGVRTAAAVTAGAATVGTSEGYTGDGSGPSFGSAEIASVEAAAEGEQTSSSDGGGGGGAEARAAHRRRYLHSAAATAEVWAAAEADGVAPGDPGVAVSSLDPIHPIQPMPIVYDSGAVARALADDDPYASWPVVATVSFTVADPRPPTVELKVSAFAAYAVPAWCAHGGPLHDPDLAARTDAQAFDVLTSLLRPPNSCLLHASALSALPAAHAAPLGAQRLRGPRVRAGRQLHRGLRGGRQCNAHVVHGPGLGRAAAHHGRRRRRQRNNRPGGAAGGQPYGRVRHAQRHGRVDRAHAGAHHRDGRGDVSIGGGRRSLRGTAPGCRFVSTRNYECFAVEVAVRSQALSAYG